MNRYVKKALCVLLTVTFAFSLASCSGGKVSEGDIKSLFKDTSKISFSYDYTELKDSRKNKTKSWRQGMVSGNGLQGFITSGSPYSDTFIFQNMHFIMPNENQRTCPQTYDELETVKQSIKILRITRTMMTYTVITRAANYGLILIRKALKNIFAIQIMKHRRSVLILRIKTALGSVHHSLQWQMML